MYRLISIILIPLFLPVCVPAQQIAFPGAEGFGAYATGGRGGTVYRVTNLHDSGAGSFRDAVSQPGRTIIFEVGGVIKIKDKIKAAPRITIAGQTAPGEGIVIYGNGISFSDSSIIRYIRLRGSIGMSRGSCTVVADNCKAVIFDHVSIQWGRWDNLHIKNSADITLQYCIIGESIDPQRFGALLEGPVDLTIHHCLWIDNQSRNPKAKAGIEFVNNIIYNWGASGFVGGHSAANHYQDLINNYFIAGPSSTSNYLSMFTATDHVYHSGNYTDLNKDGALNGVLVTDADFIGEKATLVKNRQNLSPVAVTAEPAEAAFQQVLHYAGASLRRDAVDKRITGYLQTLGKKGQIFKNEADAGGQGKIKGGRSARDSDRDGIPDKWEKANGLNPKDASDGNTLKGNGYTNLEEYINGLVKTPTSLHGQAGL